MRSRLGILLGPRREWSQTDSIMFKKGSAVRSSESQNGHMRGSGALERGGADAGGCTGGEHIVDEKQPQAMDGSR